MVIGICDDDEKFLNMIYVNITYFVEEYARDYEVYMYNSAESLLEDNYKKFDILFLDVEMYGMNGMELASKIRENDKHVLFIFITAYINYAPEGFVVSAFRYIIKPVTYEQLVIELLAAENVLKNKKRVYLLLRESGKNIYVNGDDIYYIESQRNNLVFTLGDRKIVNKGTIKDLLKCLNHQFCQVHRSYIVNFAKIKGRDKNDLIMENGQNIPVSKYRLQQFEKKYANYWKNLL